MKEFKEVFHEPPYKGISVNCALSYVDSYSLKMIRVCTLQSLSDHPSEQYVSYSGDNGRTYSTLIRHSNGKLYWIGNITDKNPRGNSPRYSLIIGELDEDKIALKKKSITIIDTRKNNKSEHLQLSNFSVYEDRETKHIVVTLARLISHGIEDWTASCILYRIKVE